MVTDFQVEHLQSQVDHEALKFEWSNLFLSCSYCNQKKSNSFSTVYSPAKNNVEEEIIATVSFQQKRVTFDLTTDKAGAEILTELLKRIYNGVERTRKTKEEHFFEYFISRMNVFQDQLLGYKESPNDKFRMAIIEELQVNKEFLAFKLQILKESKLLSEFEHCVVWNKTEK